MNKEHTYSLFQQNSTKQSVESESIESIKRLESSVFNNFSARRNAARIDHYFVKLHSFRFKLFIYIISAILAIFVVVAASVSTNQLYIGFINTNSIAMMDIIHKKISTTINSCLFEPHFFSNIFCDLFKKPEFLVPNGENAKNITQMMYKANLAGSGYIILWEIGLPWGEAISLETSSKNNYLIHANTTYDEPGILQYWPTDSQCQNQSYPEENGIPILNNYNCTTRDWYEAGIRAEGSTWTNIYEGVGSHGQILLVSSVKPSISKDSQNKSTITTVISNSIDLKIAQEFIISQQPSNNSRLALTTSSGTVLAMTGDDKLTTDEFTDLIVTKQLEEIEDYIWRCVTSHSNYLDDADNQSQCMVNGKIKQFHLSKEIIESAPGVEWVLWSVLSIDDFVGNVAVEFRSILIVTLVIVICLWIFLNLGSILLTAYIESMQNRILSNQDNFLDSKESRRHVKPIGVIFAIQELQSLIANNTENQVITSEITEVIEELQSPYHELLYNKDDVYNMINNPEVKNALVGLYGVPPTSSGISTSAFTSKNDKPTSSVKFNLNTHSNLNRNENIDANSFSNSDSENASLGTQNNGFHDCYRRQLDPTKRICQLQITPQMMKNRILMIFLQYNSRCRMFMNDDFHIIIEATIKEIGDPIDKLAADSIDFLHTLCRKFDYILNDPDFELALIITALIWHMHMKDRNEEGIDRINRYFVTSQKVKDLKATARNFLLTLFPKRIGNDEYNQRWDSFCSCVLALVETSTISLHCTVISQFMLMSKWVTERGGSSLNYLQKITFVRLLFNFSMVSFFFHPEQFRIAYSRIINPDYDDSIEEIQKFSHCIFSELIDPTVSVLRCICEPQFFISMRCE